MGKDKGNAKPRPIISIISELSVMLKINLNCMLLGQLKMHIVVFYMVYLPGVC